MTGKQYPINPYIPPFFKAYLHSGAGMIHPPVAVLRYFFLECCRILANIVKKAATIPPITFSKPGRKFTGQHGRPFQMFLYRLDPVSTCMPQILIHKHSPPYIKSNKLSCFIPVSPGPRTVSRKRASSGSSERNADGSPEVRRTSSSFALVMPT